MTETRRIACVNSNCGTFPMDEALFQQLRRTGETFTCPEGHKQHFTESKEKQQKEKINSLQNKVKNLKRRVESKDSTIDDLYDDWREEKNRRKFAESRLLDYAKGVVEVAEDQFRWSCECDSRGQKTFDDVEDAKSAFQEHRRRRCTLDEPSEVSVNAE